MNENFKEALNQIIYELNNSLALLEILVVAIEYNECEAKKLYLNLFARKIEKDIHNIYTKLDKLLLGE